jgi:hypothetical protein
VKEIRHLCGIEKNAGINNGRGLALAGGAKGFTQMCEFYIDTAIFITELIRMAARAVSSLPRCWNLMRHIMNRGAAGVTVT